MELAFTNLIVFGTKLKIHRKRGPLLTASAISLLLLKAKKIILYTHEPLTEPHLGLN
jgi:hypothetical protein